MTTEAKKSCPAICQYGIGRLSLLGFVFGYLVLKFIVNLIFPLHMTEELVQHLVRMTDMGVLSFRVIYEAAPGNTVATLVLAFLLAVPLMYRLRHLRWPLALVVLPLLPQIYHLVGLLADWHIDKNGVLATMGIALVMWVLLLVCPGRNKPVQATPATSPATKAEVKPVAVATTATTAPAPKAAPKAAAKPAPKKATTGKAAPKKAAAKKPAAKKAAKPKGKK